MIERLIHILHSGNHSLVIDNGSVHTFDGRGVSDLYRIYNTEPHILQGAALADKVVGKGAAALMALGNIRQLHADVISRPALELLDKHNIIVTYSVVVDNIINRQGSGICPVETLCLPCLTAEQCLPQITQFINRLQQLKTKNYMTSSLKLYTLGYSEMRTYLVASLFILGNIIVPQIFHLLPQGGLVWLPIYFFTLVGAYKYGWKVGLLTAILSPIINSMLFGMPAVAALPAIMIKSTALAFVAGLFASRFNKAALWQLLIVVLSYQFVGTLGEWMLKGDFFMAIQDFRIGIPGMLMQIVGGWLVINYLIRD